MEKDVTSTTVPDAAKGMCSYFDGFDIDIGYGPCPNPARFTLHARSKYCSAWLTFHLCAEHYDSLVDYFRDEGQTTDAR